MDDGENEVLDWENEDDEQNQPKNGDSRRQSVVDVDADDAVSLGDEDEQHEVLEDPTSQSKAVPQIYDVDADRSYRDQERSYSRETLNAPQKSDQNSSDRRAHHRRRSSRGSPPPRSQPTLQPPPRLTHALPPKPGLAVVAAAVASPAARGSTSQKGSGARNLSSSSPSYHSNKKPSDWETRTSSKGDTYYYNTVTCKSAWSMPADERDFESDDGRRGTYHVPPSTAFRSSPTVSDRASQDAHRHNEPLRDGDRHYHPETDSGRQAGRYRNAEAGSDSFVEVDYAPGPTRRDRNADNSREQKAYPEDDSRRRSRIPIADTYTPVEDTHPAPTRRRSSPPRGLQSQSQASDRPPIAAPRRRPASPSPPTTLPPSRPGPDAYDRRPYEQALSSATLPKEPRATREVRDERPIEPRRIPTGPAPVAYTRSTNPRYRGEELVPKLSRVTRQTRDEERNPDSTRGAPRAQELEGYRSSNPMSVSYDDRRPVYPQRDEIPPTKQRIVEGSGYRPASPPRQEPFVPSATYTREIDRIRDDHDRISSRRPFSDERGDTLSHQAPRRRTSRSRTPERYPPPVSEPERPRPQPRDHYEPQLPAITIRENYSVKDYRPPPRYAEPPPPERHVEYSRPSPIDDGRPPQGPASRPVEPTDAYRPRPSHPPERVEPPPPPVREVYKEPAIPTGPREMTREPPREPRQDASPGRRRRGEREAARQMTSGTNAVPLGKNRYLANNESTASNTVHPPPPQHPPQRYADLPTLEPPSHRERPQERDIGRRDLYEPPPEPVRYRDQQPPATIYGTARRATPPPQDYSTRVSDPHSRPPHMAQPRRGPVTDYRSGPSRREPGRSPPPPPRVEIRPPPPEARRQLNGDTERYREPDSPNLSRNVSSSTLAGSGNSWISEPDRRPSRPGSTTMDVDPRPDRYPPPSDKFREALRVSSNGHDSRRDNNGPPPPNRLAHPILPVPPVNLPSNPMLTGRDQRTVDPPERSPVTTRWSDRPPLPHIKPDAPLPLVAPRPPLSPTTSKKILSETEVSPPRLRRPSASVVTDRKAQDEAAPRERERDRGPDRERMERDRDWDREREKERAERDRGLYDRPPNRSQAPSAFVARTGSSLLDRLEAPNHASSANSIPVGNGAPSLFDRMSAPLGTVPMKRSSEQMFGGGGRMDTDDLYGPVEDSSDVAKKRRRNAGARQRRGGGKRN